MIVDFIENGPYVRRMISTPGEPDLLVPESFHEQTDEELTENDLKRMDADDQAIQTILVGLPEDVYAAVDSCEIAKEIWECVRQMMKGLDIGEQEKKEKLFNEWGSSQNIASSLKFLNNLQPKWKRHVTIVRQTKNLYEPDFTQIYDFLKMNQEEVNKLRVEHLAKSHDPLALMAHSQSSYNFPTTHKDQSSSSTHSQQSFPINNNGFQVAQNAGVQSGGNQNGLVVILGITNQNGTGNVVAARAEGIGNGNQARGRSMDLTQAEEFDFMDAAGDLDKIEEVNANCILMVNLQNGSTSGTQLDEAPVYDTDGSAEVQLNDNCYDNEIFNMFTQEEQYTDLLEPILEPQIVPQNDNRVTSIAPSMVQSGGAVETGFAPNEETRAHQETVYHNLVDQVAQVNMVNCNMRATNAELKYELARYKIQEQRIEVSREKYDMLEKCYLKSVYQEQCLTRKMNALHLRTAKQITTLNDEISNLNKQLSKEKSSISSYGRKEKDKT
uniref:Gag-Pol polyprotein n=1 Tax=Tanacetum cinerariifolium TaxID=118510 RepID=A0A6L2JCT1_TANCI|nr:hypothetical protein [Tanacetum cinerariifolium]